MKPISRAIKGYSGPNPFRDNQSRNYSDEKLISEFCPTSDFWSLFNDQHEIIIGTRGSGKTFLLKMMRYSMLERISDPKAIEILKSNNYFGLYLPLHLEFVKALTKTNLQESEKITLFQFAFNCLLAESIISEVKSFINSRYTKIELAKKNYEITQLLHCQWFTDRDDCITELDNLGDKIRKKYTIVLFTSKTLDEDMMQFFDTIGTPLKIIKDSLLRMLGFEKEPTWIICIDEAEFLDECFQKCINTVFRSDSNRIAFKVATLPFYHKTLETLKEGINIVPNNDFSYHVVDMECDSLEFKNFTNQLCMNRIAKRVGKDIPLVSGVTTLEDFIGIIGKDGQIDYYRNEVGDEASDYLTIEKSIISEFSDRRRDNAENYPNKRKTIYDKFAPVFFVREMYKRSRKGNSKPGWYAGSDMIRRISQGNPRIFIQIMNELFERAQVSELTAKTQHEVLLKFSQDYCRVTEAIETYGPLAAKMLDTIAQEIHDSVHNSFIKSIGVNFRISFPDKASLKKHQKWIILAIAYSRLIVRSDVIVNGIDENTVYHLSNGYAANYWIPMRADGEPKQINCSLLDQKDKEGKKGKIGRSVEVLPSLFDEE